MTTAPGILALALALAPQAQGEPAAPGPTVGMPATIRQLVLPGTELEAIPLRDRETPVVVRIAEVYPHGDAFRYDLIYYGLEPGAFDLRTYLRRKDGTGTAELPPIPVTIRAILPPGQIEPNAPARPRLPRLGGYRWLLLGLGTLWVAGLAAFLMVGPARARLVARPAPAPLTLADQLRPLVEQARNGTLPPRQFADLERLLIGYWRRRLHLEDMGAAEALATLKKNEEAGPLIRQVEDWLHRPGAARDVDVAALLEPYKDLGAEAEPEIQDQGGPVAVGARS